ncbi:P-loop containing nucleoside triphosphate hydrolase protein, partial [Chytriomyces cf. hyalinus JEL632]
RTRKPLEPTQTYVGNRLHAPDLLVRSKTGTGKTLAFIVAAVESVLKSPGGFNRTAVTPILVIALSRELAHQIYEEAKVIIRAHRLNAVSLVGGDDRAKQRKKIVYDPVQLIVATPGRLLDLLQYEPKLKLRLRGVKVLIYDEADLLLEYGFSVAMERILKYLPPREERQTFMFSATISDDIKLLATETMRPSQTISIDTVALNQSPTHLTTKQTHIQCPYSLQPQLLLHLLKHHIATTPQSKIIVFFPTTHLTAHLAQEFNNVSNLNVLQIHSQIDQRERMRVSDRFRASRGSSILFTSDVSAHGNYPDVTLVLQMDPHRNLDQYIHRVGRNGRAGKPGQAIIVHTRYETPFIEKVLLGNGGLPIKRDLVHNPQVIARDKAALQTLKDAHRKADWSVGSACYASFLGYCRGFGSEVMTLPNETLGLCGLPMVPKVGSGLLTRLRLRVDDGVKVLKPGEDPDTLPNTESTPPPPQRTSPTPSKGRSRK